MNFIIGRDFISVDLFGLSVFKEKITVLSTIWTNAEQRCKDPYAYLGTNQLAKIDFFDILQQPLFNSTLGILNILMQSNGGHDKWKNDDVIETS